MIIRVDRVFAPYLPAEHLNSTIRDDFVDIHVRLRTTASLPDREREVRVQRAINHLPRGSTDSLRKTRFQQTELGVDMRDGPFNRAECPQSRARDAFVTDMKILKGALRLRTPILIRWDMECAHAICFYSCHIFSRSPCVNRLL